MKKQSLPNYQMIRHLSEYPDLLTVQEASELLGVCTKTVYSMIKKKELKKINVGRLIRIPKSFITDYLDIECKK